MTLLAILRTWMLVLTVHGHGPYHGHSTTQGGYYTSQSACEAAAVELQMQLNAQGAPATAVCIEGGQ